jgi:hypothetical protein
MIDLDKLQEMWEKDAKIDMDNLHDESTNIPKADPDVYIDNPFPKKIRDKDTMQKYLDADEKLSTVCLKIDYYDTMLVYIESILKQITNRTYQIKNAIEFMRFNAGLG